MNTIIINDCRDSNAAGRQAVRATALLGGPVTFVGVGSDLEAAGTIIDALDALTGQAGVILANVAPRSGHARRWGNGTPFGYTWIGQTLLVASVDGLTWSLIKKLKLTDTIQVIDAAGAVQKLSHIQVITPEERDRMLTTQFRSYDFLPRVASTLLRHEVVPSQSLPIANIPDAPLAVWWVDNFGNCKTTLLPRELALDTDGDVSTPWRGLRHYSHLSDAPDGELALVTGSSGFGQDRFVELVVNGGRAADALEKIGVS